MRVETEREFKFQLTKEDFYKLQDCIESLGYKKTEVVNQVNYYIDTEKFSLRNSGTTLRVRHFIDNDTYELTAKVKNNNGEEDKELKVKEEVTIDISKNCAEDILNNNNMREYIYLFEDKAELFNNKKLVVLGSLSTERTNYFIREDAMLSFDKSKYFNKEDYEIELETVNVDEDREFLNHIFKKAEVEVFKENKSKVKRFIEEFNIR